MYERGLHGALFHCHFSGVLGNPFACNTTIQQADECRSLPALQGSFTIEFAVAGLALGPWPYNDMNVRWGFECPPCYDCFPLQIYTDLPAIDV